VADGQLHAHRATDAVPEDVGPFEAQVIQQRADVAGQRGGGDGPADISHATVALLLDADHRWVAARAGIGDAKLRSMVSMPPCSRTRGVPPP